MGQEHTSNQRAALAQRLFAACLAGETAAAEEALALGADPYFYDPAKDLDTVGACAASGNERLLARLLRLAAFEPGDSSLEDALAASLGAGQGPCACALLEAGAPLDPVAMDRGIALGALAPIALLIERGHLRPAKRSDRAALALRESDPWDPLAPPLERALGQAAKLGQKEIFLALLAAEPWLKGPLAQETGLWVALAGWDDAASALLQAGFEPTGSTLIRWRELLAAPLLAYEERKALSRRSRKKAPPASGEASWPSKGKSL